MSSDTFSYVPETRSFIRNSDEQVMATLAEDNKTLEWTHSSRELHYSDDILPILASLDFSAPPAAPAPPAATPPAATPPPAAAPVMSQRKGIESPPPHPQFGSYSDVHLLHDNTVLDDAAFTAKWGGPMALSTTRLAMKSPIFSEETGNAIADRVG